MGRNWMSAERRQHVIETAERTVADQLRRPRDPRSARGAAEGRARTRSAARRARPRAGPRCVPGKTGSMTTETSRESSNGSGPEAAARAAAGAASASSSLARMAGRLIGAVAQEAQRRVPSADLDERDPDYIRETLPGLWMLASLYFRADVRGLQNIPEEGPVLLVGNHSGGNLTPDTHVFTLAFSTYFGVERRFHQLAHNLVLSMPGLGMLRRYGTVAATPENAERALDSGAALLVYPGGDYEVHRPSWESARVDFGGRRGFIRLAKSRGVPLVPVVAIGGQETALFLSRGERIARLLGHRPHVPAEGAADLARAALGHERGRHARPHPAAREDHDPGARADRRVRAWTWTRPTSSSSARCRPHSPGSTRNAACPSSADAGRNATSPIDASREEIWELVSDPDNYPRFWHGLTRLDRKNDEQRLRRPLRHAHARRLRRHRRPDRDRRVRRARRHGVAQHHRHRPPRPLAPARGRRRAHQGDPAASPGTRPVACSEWPPTASARRWWRASSSKPFRISLSS